MNIIFAGQSAAVKMFFLLMKELKKDLSLDKTGFYVSHSLYFDSFSKNYPDINDYPLLKEWDITKKAKSTKVNYELLGKYEKQIGDPFLWGPLVGDRRIYLGKNCELHQNYKPRFSHKEMLKILQTALLEIEGMLDTIKPDVIISYAPVTFGDYLFYLFAKTRNIQFLNIRSIKIDNFVRVSKNLFGVPATIFSTFNQYENNDNAPDSWQQKAEVFVNNAQKNKIIYEGTILSKNKNNGKDGLIKLIDLFRDECKYLFSESRKDNHVNGCFFPRLYQHFIKPLKIKYVDAYMKNKYLNEKDLNGLEYAFFPLHTEPEVSLSVYSKHLMNQIETIRLISWNLPVCMKLVIKEHPVSIGKRPLSYYKKLLEIPNVLLVNPKISSDVIIKNSKIVTTISSSVAFESILQRIPAITLGDLNECPFSILPDTMIRNVHDITQIGKNIDELLRNYSFNKKSLINYVAASMKESVAVNYYNNLLERPGIAGNKGDEPERQKDYETLSRYLSKIINQK